MAGCWHDMSHWTGPLPRLDRVSTVSPPGAKTTWAKKTDRWAGGETVEITNHFQKLDIFFGIKLSQLTCDSMTNNHFWVYTWKQKLFCKDQHQTFDSMTWLHYKQSLFYTVTDSFGSQLLSKTLLICFIELGLLLNLLLSYLHPIFGLY